MDLTRTRPPNPYDHLPAKPEFTVTSDDVTDGQFMAETHAHGSAGGRNLSPQLSWSDFPADTKGFAVTCYDPDAPTGAGWWHWILIGLPADCTSLAQGAGSADGDNLPTGARQLRNDYSTYDFGGAAPPAGDHFHRYFFTVFALDTDDLGMPEDPSAAVASFVINAHTIARGHITPVFKVD